MAREIESLTLTNIAPPSIAGDKNVQDLFAAIDPDMMKVSEQISEAFIISRIHELPEPVLDLLAWQWHVDFYELSDNIDAKRSMVLNSIAWHRKKGTRWAILQALEMLGVEARFTSWQDLQDEGAEPYTFVIDAKLTPDFWQRVDWTKPTQTIRRAIMEAKAERSWMSRLYVYMETFVSQGISHDIGLIVNDHAEATQNLSAGGIVTQGVFHSITMHKSDGAAMTDTLSAGCIITCGAYIEVTMRA